MLWAHSSETFKANTYSGYVSFRLAKNKRGKYIIFTFGIAMEYLTQPRCMLRHFSAFKNIPIYLCLLAPQVL